MRVPRLVLVQFVVKVIGAIVVLAYCIAGGLQEFRERWYLAVIILFIETATVMLPFFVNRAGVKLEYSADVMVIVAAALLLPTRVGSLTVSCGYALGCALGKQVGFARLEDIAAEIMGCFLALSVAHFIGAPGLGVNSIVGAATTALIYDPFGFLLFTIWAVLDRQVRFWSFLQSGLIPASTTWPWMICLGILLGTLGWDAPWALLLMAAPIALVFMASRSRVEATEDRTRLDGLLRATTEILAATTIRSVTEAATLSINSLFEGREGNISPEEPQEGELHAVINSHALGTQYLIVGAGHSLMFGHTDHDRLLLETLASITASALDKAALHEDVTEQATRDALTGLVNRRAFEAELQSSVIGKRSTDTSGVMFLDLDGFKKINDEHGHKAGDEVLIETAKRLLLCVRDGDTVARLGGDEFTVLLRAVHSEDEAAIVAERILSSMRQPMHLSNGVVVRPTPSLGIALAGDHGTDPGKLLKDADAAMYEAKRAGKDCWCLADDSIASAI